MDLPARYFNLFLVLILGAVALAQDRTHTEDEVLRYAKSIDVAELDSTLSSQPLEQWLLHGPARIDELHWRISPDCDLKDDEPEVEKDRPLCVKIGFRRGSITGFGVLRVGTTKSGLTGRPEFHYLDVLFPLGIGDYKGVGNYKKLSEFPGYLDRIPEYGTLCVYPPVSRPAINSSVGQYDPAKLKLHIDDRPELHWPLKQPIKIRSLDLLDRHVVKIRAGNKQVQVLEFDFNGYREGTLCLAFDGSKLAHLESSASANWCSCE